MKTRKCHYFFQVGLLAALCGPAFATVSIASFTPSVASPQKVGKVITFNVTATNTNPGPLTFRFKVAPPGGRAVLVEDFNGGTQSSGIWTARPFVWAPTKCTNVTQPSGVVALTCGEIEGTYQVQVTVKDFTSGETTSQTVPYQIRSLVTGGTPVVVKTLNPLVALFSNPSCATGSSMRVSFQEQSQSTPATTTNWVKCHPPTSMNFEIAGMYPSTVYTMRAETKTGGTITKGPSRSFTTGALPTNLTFPTAKVNIAAGSQTYTTYPMLLVNPHQFGNGPIYPNVATDLSGNVMWYYTSAKPLNLTLARPLTNGTMLTIQDASNWNGTTTGKQELVQIDLAGNIIRKTNADVVEEELTALGSVDGGSCDAIPRPAPVGSACSDGFNHDVIQTLPNGYTIAQLTIEKIFPPGTQGDTSGLPVDILGEIIIAMDTDWQVVWYFDAFEHDGGPPQLDINRPAVLGETCVPNEQGCTAAMFLMGPGISPEGKDWLHSNSIYYWPQDQLGNPGQLIWSSRHQDWVMKIDYRDGTGTGNIIWRMGNEGDFTFNNINNDPWPWFSHQHEVGIENNGAGPLSILDNGNTRINPPPLGLGNHCGPSDCHTRGMAVTFDESTMQVTPVLSDDLGLLSSAGGSAQLLPDGNYYFQLADVLLSLNSDVSQSLEILPTAGTLVGTQVLNVQTVSGYRGWQVLNLYNPPIS